MAALAFKSPADACRLQHSTRTGLPRRIVLVRSYRDETTVTKVSWPSSAAGVAVGAALLWTATGACPAPAGAFTSSSSSYSTSITEERPKYLMLERQRIERLMLGEFADRLAELTDEELTDFLEDVMRSRRTSSAPELWDRAARQTANQQSRLSGSRQDAPSLSGRQTASASTADTTPSSNPPFSSTPNRDTDLSAQTRGASGRFLNGSSSSSGTDGAALTQKGASAAKGRTQDTGPTSYSPSTTAPATTNTTNGGSARRGSEAGQTTNSPSSTPAASPSSSASSAAPSAVAEAQQRSGSGGQTALSSQRQPNGTALLDAKHGEDDDDEEEEEPDFTRQLLSRSSVAPGLNPGSSSPAVLQQPPQQLPQQQQEEQQPRPQQQVGEGPTQITATAGAIAASSAPAASRPSTAPDAPFTNDPMQALRALASGLPDPTSLLPSLPSLPNPFNSIQEGPWHLPELHFPSLPQPLPLPSLQAVSVFALDGVLELWANVRYAAVSFADSDAAYMARELMVPVGLVAAGTAGVVAISMLVEDPVEETQEPQQQESPQESAQAQPQQQQQQAASSGATTTSSGSSSWVQQADEVGAPGGSTSQHATQMPQSSMAPEASTLQQQEQQEQPQQQLLGPLQRLLSLASQLPLPFLTRQGPQGAASAADGSTQTNTSPLASSTSPASAPDLLVPQEQQRQAQPSSESTRPSGSGSGSGAAAAGPMQPDSEGPGLVRKAAVLQNPKLLRLMDNGPGLQIPPPPASSPPGVAAAGAPGDAGSGVGMPSTGVGPTPEAAASRSASEASAPAVLWTRRGGDASQPAAQGSQGSQGAVLWRREDTGAPGLRRQSSRPRPPPPPPPPPVMPSAMRMSAGGALPDGAVQYGGGSSSGGGGGGGPINGTSEDSAAQFTWRSEVAGGPSPAAATATATAVPVVASQFSIPPDPWVTSTAPSSPSDSSATPSSRPLPITVVSSEDGSKAAFGHSGSVSGQVLSATAADDRSPWDLPR